MRLAGEERLEDSGSSEVSPRDGVRIRLMAHDAGARDAIRVHHCGPQQPAESRYGRVGRVAPGREPALRVPSGQRAVALDPGPDADL